MPHRRACRGPLLLIGVLLAAAAPAFAQDTPEMLAAMQSHLPPLPTEIPVRDALAPALRAEIPAFRIEVHRWHADPALRFVMIHERRIEEGGVVDRELWLREIRAGAVVMQFRDAFFVQPLR